MPKRSAVLLSIHHCNCQFVCRPIMNNLPTTHPLRLNNTPFQRKQRGHGPYIAARPAHRPLALAATASGGQRRGVPHHLCAALLMPIGVARASGLQASARVAGSAGGVAKLWSTQGAAQTQQKPAGRPCGAKESSAAAAMRAPGAPGLPPPPPPPPPPASRPRCRRVPAAGMGKLTEFGTHVTVGDHALVTKAKLKLSDSLKVGAGLALLLLRRGARAPFRSSICARPQLFVIVPCGHGAFSAGKARRHCFPNSRLPDRWPLPPAPPLGRPPWSTGPRRMRWRSRSAASAGRWPTTLARR